MRRIHRSWLPLAAAALAAIVVLPGFAAPTDAATSKWVAKCETKIRTSPSTSATVKRIISTSTVVTATGTVSGSSYRADCPSAVSGSSWLKIVAINGKSTLSLWGRSAVYAAAKLFKAGPAPTATPTVKPTPTPTPKPTATPAPSTTDYLSNCGVRLRTSTSTSATTKSIIDSNMVVTAASKVSGGSWAADCKTSVSGSSWYKITAVGGKSVSSLYGVSAVYAATGLFRIASTSSGYKEGIDVSHWQGVIDWAKVRGAGKTFVIAKATEGTSFLDDRYKANRSGAMGQGMKFGAYHFAQPANNPVTEADWFVNQSGYQRGMLVPTLDLERTGGRGPTALTSWVKSWLGRVYDRLGVRPMIYVSPSFWRSNMSDTRWFADNGYAILWTAHWGTTSPSVPGSNWGGRSWTFWQYSSDGTVPGISGRVDLDRYRFATFDAVTY